MELTEDDEINAWFHERDRTKSLSQVRSESRRIFEQLVSAIEKFPEDTLDHLDRFPWWQGGPPPSGDEGIWRCLSVIKLSSVEWLDGPWRTEPHAPQRCVWHVEVDADDYPGGDPQKGQ